MKIFTRQVLEKAIDYFIKIACLYIFIVYNDLLEMYHTPWRIDIKYKKNFAFVSAIIIKTSLFHTYCDLYLCKYVLQSFLLCYTISQYVRMKLLYFLILKRKILEHLIQYIILMNCTIFVSYIK